MFELGRSENSRGSPLPVIKRPAGSPVQFSDEEPPHGSAFGAGMITEPVGYHHQHDEGSSFKHRIMVISRYAPFVACWTNKMLGNLTVCTQSFI